jgi:hypothetical protein
MDYASQTVNTDVCHHLWEHLLSCYEYQHDGNEHLLGRNIISVKQVRYWINCTTCVETFWKVESNRTIITNHCFVINVTCHIKFIVWCEKCISVYYWCSGIRAFRTLKHTLSSTRYFNIAMLVCYYGSTYVIVPGKVNNALRHSGGSGTCVNRHYQESTEIIQSLENLNTEIREIWEVLNKQQKDGTSRQGECL